MHEYKLGMFGGKFMPFHKGHLYCVDEALKWCDRLYLILFVNGKDEDGIIQSYAPCRTEDGKEDWEAETPLVLNACTEGMFDVIFGSEESYRSYFEKAYPQATFHIIDPKRNIVPISATKVRNMTEEEAKGWMV